MAEETSYRVRISVEGMDRKALNVFYVPRIYFTRLKNTKEVMEYILHDRVLKVVDGWLYDVLSRPLPSPEVLLEPEAELPWAGVRNRCRAVKEPNGDGFWGRCELKKNHEVDHALERGMDIPRWSTRWTR